MADLIEFIEKRIYKKSKKYKDEYYNACLDSSGKIPGLLALKVSGLSETLVYLKDRRAQEIRLSSNGYILDPCFAGGYAVWSEMTEKGWKVCGVKFTDGIPGQRFTAFHTEGRARGFNVIHCENADILIWEERIGKHTYIRGCKIDDNGFNEPLNITDGSFNAYDPSGLVTDNSIFIAFTGFFLGDYRAMCVCLDESDLKPKAPVILSSALGSVLYTSISKRSAGGLWFTYTQVECRNNEAYIQHPLARSQHSFKIKDLPTRLYAGFLVDGEKHHIENCLNINTGRGAGPAHIMEDMNGLPFILLRQYVEDGTRLSFNDNLYTASDQELKTLPDVIRDRNSRGNNHYPNISLIRFYNGKWAQPADIIPRAHFESPVSYHFNGDMLTVAYTQDRRHTGWCKNGEWFDENGELEVGIAKVRLLESSQEGLEAYYKSVPLFLPDFPGNIIEEKHVPAMNGTYIQALGQTHAHSNTSVCMRMEDRSIHFNYRFMQDVQHSDFGAVTDHDYNMWETEKLWMHKMAEYYYFPGEFVSIPAYEWTGSGVRHEGGPFGHVNPFYLEETGNLPICCAVDEKNEGCSLYKLWQVYRGRKVITPPHHPADKMHYYRWCYFDSDFTPVVEIFQDYRGSGEQPDTAGVTNYPHSFDTGSWALDGLKQGLRFGFIAGADHAGIARAGVLVKELTRSGLYEAFMARRTFATTNQTLRLEFTGNGEWMGSSVVAEEVRFNMRVLSAEPVFKVEIVRNGDTVKILKAEGNSFSYHWDVKREQSGEFWYLRIIFANGEVAWSSPIWIDE